MILDGSYVVGTRRVDEHVQRRLRGAQLLADARIPASSDKSAGRGRQIPSAESSAAVSSQPRREVM